MFSEILKIIPKLDNGDLAKMESSLTSRFGRISKKFGKGLIASLTGGGIAGIALGFIDKLLNPLKEVQDAIDKSLKHSDDIVTNAERFGTTAGKLFKLQQVGVATGLPEETLNMMLEKFQNSIAMAIADPSAVTAVRQFVPKPVLDKEGQPKVDPTTGRQILEKQDTAETFFKFIQAMSKLPTEQRALVEQEIFGERLILKAADFVNSAKDGFAQQLRIMKAAPAETYTPGLNKLGSMNDLADALTAQRNMKDMLTKSELISGDMILQRNRQEQANLDRENAKLTRDGYQALVQMDVKVTKMMSFIEQGYLELLKVVNKATNFEQILQGMGGSRVFRLFTPGKGD